MKSVLATIFICALATPAFADEAGDFARCSITPVDQVGFIDTFKTPGECEAACKEADGCDSWSFRPHSFDSTKPGQCKLISGIFAEEESTSTYCGKL